MNKILSYFKKLYKIINNPQMRILPGHLAFFLILSIIPIITLVGFVCSIFSISIVDITKFISELIPSEIEEILIPFVSKAPNGTNIFLFLTMGILLASNGAHSIILASNSLYNIDNTNYLTRRIKALFLTIILMIAFFFILIFLAFGNVILEFVLSLKIFASIASEIYVVFILLKWPIAFIIVFLLVKIIYTMSPDKKIPSKYMNSGAFFTTFGWILITAIYSYYVSNIANYNLFYGNLSNIIILMIWIYIIANIFVIGIAMNVNIYNNSSIIGTNRDN